VQLKQLQRSQFTNRVRYGCAQRVVVQRQRAQRAQRRQRGGQRAAQLVHAEVQHAKRCQCAQPVGQRPHQAVVVQGQRFKAGRQVQQRRRQLAKQLVVRQVPAAVQYGSSHVPVASKGSCDAQKVEPAKRSEGRGKRAAQPLVAQAPASQDMSASVHLQHVTT